MDETLRHVPDFEGIETAETCAAVRVAGVDYATFARARIKSVHDRIADLNLAHATGEPVRAFVSASRWLWRCECGAGNHVWLGGGNVCLECNNAITHGRPRVIVMPGAGQREQIEKLLLMRKDKASRNWQPGETLMDLRLENIRHGEVD